MTGDEASARKWFEDFLALWKDADPDVPIYRQVKAEQVRQAPKMKIPVFIGFTGQAVSA
jgi:hypothetical protein